MLAAVLALATYPVARRGPADLAAYVVLAGLGLAAGSRAARRLPALRVPLRLAALWSFGYDSASLLLTFGVMAVVCVALDGLMRVLSFRPSPSTRCGGAAARS